MAKLHSSCADLAPPVAGPLSPLPEKSARSHPAAHWLERPEICRIGAAWSGVRSVVRPLLVGGAESH